MGGDSGLTQALEGAQDALPELRSRLVLVGDEKLIRVELHTQRALRKLQAALTRSRIDIVHAPDVIEMEDKIQAIRSKSGASINVGMKLLAKEWKEHHERNEACGAAFVSAGHSGAVMASALLHLGRVSGIERPAIAARLPTLEPHGVLTLDVGANIDCTPEMLRDFALMGVTFVKAQGSPRVHPRVAILSNGEERTKGTELTRKTFEILLSHPAFQGAQRLGEFVGYCEGKEIFEGHLDVVVTDGFTGNVLLKTAEGLGSAIGKLIRSEARKQWIGTLGLMIARGVFRRVGRKLDYAETGGAPLLGVKGSVFIAHGRSNARAFKNALLHAENVALQGYASDLDLALRSQETERASSI
jgi:glycerol-3-phosphate acyltransferase PlsX